MEELQDLTHYDVYVKFTVLGESAEDALNYLEEAIDTSEIINEDGIVSIEIVDDADSVSESEEIDFSESDIESDFDPDSDYFNH